MGSTFGKEVKTLEMMKKTELGDLPEDCVAMILMNLDPVDVCKMTQLNKDFYRASRADFVWECKLPSNYSEIVKKILGEDSNDDDDKVLDCMSKKVVYERLSQFNSLDNGTKKVWLDKSTGGICMAISAKGLSITGIDDRRYWKQIPTQESRFTTVAYLQQIWWFEVDGEVEFPFPKGTYSVFFRLHLGNTNTNKKFGRQFHKTEQIHGWDIKPVHFKLSTSEGQRIVSQCYLEGQGKWLLYHAGDFTVENCDKPTRVKYSMTQIDCTHTKGGVCVDSVVIYPSCFKGRLMRF